MNNLIAPPLKVIPLKEKKKFQECNFTIQVMVCLIIIKKRKKKRNAINAIYNKGMIQNKKKRRNQSDTNV